jgi:membrane-associated protein
VYAGIFGTLFDNLNEWSSSWWFLLVIFAIALADSVIPIVPSETSVIIGGVAAGNGNQSLALVILAGASGAFIGDNIAYQIGRRAEPWLRRKIFKGKRAGILDKAADQIAKRGGMLLITARFIPGGRTALTLSSGITRQPIKWFVRYIFVAVCIWATYASLLGYIGGQTFGDNHTKAFLFAFALAISATVGIEIVRWFRHRGASKVAH